MSKKYYSDLGDYKPYNDKSKDEIRKNSKIIQIRINLIDDLKFKFIELSRQMNLHNASNNEIIRAMINRLYKKPYTVELKLKNGTICGHPKTYWQNFGQYSQCSICKEMDLNYGP